MALVKTTTYAPDIFKALNGILLVYKPPGLGIKQSLALLKHRIAEQLNDYEPRPISKRLMIAGDVEEEKSVIEVPNLSDHPLVVGPRYQPWDVKMRMVEPWLGKKSSGLIPVTVGPANKYFGAKLNSRKLPSVYHISGKFGYVTDTFWHDGKITDKATYKYIRPGRVDSVLARVESTQHERLFDAASVPLDSKEAYELAKSWPSRPPTMAEWPVIYRARCIHLNVPEFKLEITITNETEEFLAQFCHDFGLMLKSAAYVESIRRVKFGPFDVNDSLTSKEWDLPRILEQLVETKKNHSQMQTLLASYMGDLAIRSEHQPKFVKSI